MKKTKKIPKNYKINLVALAVLVKADYKFEVCPLNILTDWYSLRNLNAPDGRQRTKNKKLWRYLRAQQTKKQREELMKKCSVLFD